MHLVNLYPLFDSNFDVELGGDGWKKLIGNYKTYGGSVTQKFNIPSFDLMNALFDPEQIVASYSSTSENPSEDNSMVEISSKSDDQIEIDKQLNMQNDGGFFQSRRGAHST